MDKGKGTNKNENGPKEKGKRRRITKQCLDALDQIQDVVENSPPTTVEELFDRLHGTKDESLLNAMKYGLRGGENGKNFRGHRRDGDLWSSPSTQFLSSWKTHRSPRCFFNNPRNLEQNIQRR